MLKRRSPGIIASVIGVAGAGFRLSLILNAVGCEIASAGMEIHSISKGVTLFSLMLKQVGQALQAPDSVHSSEALETAQEITNECQMVFDEIREMLDKVTSKKGDGSSMPSIQQRFRWCFKKGRVQYLLAQLESLKLSLLVMLQILQLGKLMAAPPRMYVHSLLDLKHHGFRRKDDHCHITWT
jgi:N-terminal domain on NACHT_NTPase and P-loop NTPases